MPASSASDHSPVAQVLLRPGEGSSESRSLADVDNFQAGAFNVTCIGFEGGARIDVDGAFEFLPHRRSQGTSACSSCWSAVGSQPLQVPASSIVGASLEDGKAFRVWHCPVTNPGSKQQKRHLLRTAPFVCDSRGVAVQAVGLLQKLDAWWGRENAPRLAVFVNPVSGSGRAKSVWKRECLPILSAAGMDLQITETLRTGHAHELTQRLDLGALDAVVCVGGDGTMSEIVQGLFQREDRSEAIKTPLCMIPGGTGNGMAASAGLWTPVTAAHALCKGKSRGMDIVSIVQPPHRRFYSFLSVTFGLIANVDIGTEYLRCLGSARNQVGALSEILKASEHIANVVVIPSSGAAALQAGSRKAAVAADVIATPLLDFLGDLEKLGPLSSASLPEGWKLLSRTSFSLFAVSVMPWLALDFTLIPEERVDSGEMTITHLPGNLSWCEGLQIMLKADAGRITEVQKLSIEKIAGFILEPVSKGTWIVMDGEVLPYERVFAELHPSLCRLIIAA